VTHYNDINLRSKNEFLNWRVEKLINKIQVSLDEQVFHLAEKALLSTRRSPIFINEIQKDIKMMKKQLRTCHSKNSF